MSLVESIDVYYNDECIAGITFSYLDGEKSECIISEEILDDCEIEQFKVRAGKNEYIRGAITYTTEEGVLKAVKFISSYARMKLFGDPDGCDKATWGEADSGALRSMTFGDDGIEVEFDESVLDIYQQRRMRNLTGWVSSGEYGDVEDPDLAGVHGFRFNFKGGLFHDMGSKRAHKQLSVNLEEDESVTSAKIYSIDERIKFVRFMTSADRKIDFGAPELVADCDLVEIEAPEESKILILNFDLESERWEEDVKVMDFPPLTSAMFKIVEEEEEVEPEEPEEDDPFAGIDPMDLANEIADMREKMAEHYTSDKLMEILCGIDSREEIYDAMKAELSAFAEEFVEENEVLPAVPDISKLIDRYEDKCEPMYDEKMEECISNLLDAVFTDFQETHGEDIRAESGGDPDALDSIARAKIAEIAETVVMEDEFLATKGVPEDCLDRQTETVVLSLRADVQQETVLGAASTLYGHCLSAREATYIFEMSQEFPDQQEWDKSGLEEELAQFDESISAVGDMDVDLLKETDREGPLEFWKNAVSYAREELGYMRTRADYICVKGGRKMHEGFSQVTKIEGEFDKRLTYMKLTYSGGVYRQTGEKRGEGEYVEYDLTPDERIYEIKVWKHSKPGIICEGVTFFVGEEENGEYRECPLLGSKTSGFFGGRESPDKIWSKGGHYQIELQYDHGIHPHHSIDQRWEPKQPGGDWHESVDEWHWEGTRLIYTIDGRSSYFVPLPWETLKVENGMVLVDARLMSEN